MSFVTSCPACATNFHIQAEQLAVRQGDVRCGKCSHVFNALSVLAQAQPAPTETTAERTAPASADNPSVFAYTLVDQPTVTSPVIFADAVSRDKLSGPVKKKTRDWLTWLLIFLLGLLTAGQVTYHQRTWIAAQWPASQPWLAQACNVLGCKLELPQQAELLAIDDSDLQEDAEYQGLMHFSSTIINNARFRQAYPLLELTLTDLFDQPLMRRIFSPIEYLPDSIDPANGMAAGGDIKIKLALAADNPSIAGYRVFITYSKSH